MASMAYCCISIAFYHRTAAVTLTCRVATVSGFAQYLGAFDFIL